jgi:polar amino acid transport system substrate-binding protein
MAQRGKGLTMRSVKQILSLPAFVFALAMALVLTAPQAMADPNATLDRIKSSGVLKVPVMIGEEPGYVKDPATGNWGGFYMIGPPISQASLA